MALAAAGAQPVPMSRFRPNLVLGGMPAGAEDRRRTLQIGEAVALALVKRCDRCVVTTIDQGSGVKTGKEPMATLMQIRRNTRTGGAWFGQNAVPGLAGKATRIVRVGDLRDAARRRANVAAFRHPPMAYPWELSIIPITICPSFRGI